MRHPLSSLLLVLLWGFSSQGASSDTFDMSQSPDVTVTEGQTVTIDCCWTKEFMKVRVKWMKNQTEIQNETITKNNFQGSQNEQANSCSTLTFPNIKLEASGRYICSVTVDIPRLITVKGNGTVITVTARPDHNTKEGKRQNTNSSTVLYLWTDKCTRLDLCRKQRLYIPMNRICKIYEGIPPLTTGKRIGAVITDTARGNTDVNTDHHVADEISDASNEEVLVFVLRCLPILALVLAFLWLYYSGTKAQQNTQAASRNKPTAPQNREEDQEEDQVKEKEDEIVTEAARE